MTHINRSDKVGAFPRLPIGWNIGRSFYLSSKSRYCEINREEHDSKAWNLLREALGELMAHGVIDKSARNGGEVIVWSAVHGASSLAIEGLMSPSDFPMVLKSIQRSLGIETRSKK